MTNERKVTFYPTQDVPQRDFTLLRRANLRLFTALFQGVTVGDKRNATKRGENCSVAFYSEALSSTRVAFCVVCFAIKATTGDEGGR